MEYSSAVTDNIKQISSESKQISLNFSAVLIFCENIKGMTKFYAEILGLPLKQCGQTCSSFESNFGLSITLRQIEMEGKNQSRNHIILGFYVDNIEKLRERLLQKNIAVGPIELRSIGKTAELQDPEGNIIGLQELPAAK